MIKISNLRKTYNKVLFDNFSWEIHSTGVYEFVGPSGCGKTTLFRIISNEEKADEGNIEIDNYNLQDITFQDREVLRSKVVGYLSSENGFALKELSYSNNLSLMDDYDEKMEEQLKDLLQFSLENKPIYSLSGGERKKAELILFLIRDYRYCLMDEPFANLDRQSKENLENFLNDYALKHSVLIINHDITLKYLTVDYQINVKTKEITINKETKEIETVKTETKAGKAKTIGALVNYKLKNDVLEKVFLFLALICLTIGALLLPNSSSYRQKALDNNPYKYATLITDGVIDNDDLGIIIDKLDLIVLSPFVRNLATQDHSSITIMGSSKLNTGEFVGNGLDDNYTIGGKSFTRIDQKPSHYIKLADYPNLAEIYEERNLDEDDKTALVAIKDIPFILEQGGFFLFQSSVISLGQFTFIIDNNQTAGKIITRFNLDSIDLEQAGLEIKSDPKLTSYYKCSFETLIKFVLVEMSVKDCLSIYSSIERSYEFDNLGVKLNIELEKEFANLDITYLIVASCLLSIGILLFLFYFAFMFTINKKKKDDIHRLDVSLQNYGVVAKHRSFAIILSEVISIIPIILLGIGLGIVAIPLKNHLTYSFGYYQLVKKPPYVAKMIDLFWLNGMITFTVTTIVLIVVTLGLKCLITKLLLRKKAD